MAVKITKDFKKFNSKIRKLKRKAKTFEVGLFDPEEAIKGIKLNYGDPENNQPSRPWFSQNMKGANPEFVKMMEDSGQRYIEGDLTPERLSKHLISHCKSGLTNPPRKMKALADITELIKAGLVARPNTGEFKPSKAGVPAEQIGIDSGDMVDAIECKIKKNTKR